MKIGIPKGLLYYKYYAFYSTFFNLLGAEIVISPNTNKDILNMGVKYCVDEACLPMKIFHGHVAWLVEKCDLILVPRIMQLRSREFICPKFCGLPEMIKSSIPGEYEVTEYPIYADKLEHLHKWCLKTGKLVTHDTALIDYAFNKAIANQRQEEENRAYKVQKMCELDTIQNVYNKVAENKLYYNKLRIALVGHIYNIEDDFVNMNLRNKLDKMNVGVITEEAIDEDLIDKEIVTLFKKPFWYFARKSYGFASYISKMGKVDGIIYISSFACGIDSVVIELVKEKIGNFPFMVLKIDEHTGEAGLDTRIEAFVDMLERRRSVS